MTLTAQPTPTDERHLNEHPAIPAVELGADKYQAPADQEEFDSAQTQRAACYGLLAAVLQSPPDQTVLDYIAQLSSEAPPQDADELLLSMTALGLAAGLYSPAALDDEFHDLFIGLGRGEVMPYGSWYLTGFLQEKPLADLRTALSQLGYARSDETCEPEDHVAALCEVMQMMISEGREIEIQREFFRAHMAPWLDRFCADLRAAESAVFYQTLARFAAAFFAFEREYLAMQA